jgi:peptidoglycan hydrolase-like protein with peptidoglycan-binding domain
VRLIAGSLILWATLGAVPSGAQQRQGSGTTGSSGGPAVRSSVQARKSTGKAGAQATQSRKASASKSGTRKKSAASRRTRPRVQQAPTPERYIEIQQALIERGYLTGPATGKWGPECAEALKRFQQDHNLEPTGKLNALTLIALGLGPNHSPRSGPVTVPADGQIPPTEKPQ